MLGLRIKARQGHLSSNAPISGNFLIAGYAWTRDGVARIESNRDLVGVALM